MPGLLQRAFQSDDIVEQFGFVKSAAARVQQEIHPVAAYLHCDVCRRGGPRLCTADMIHRDGELSRQTEVPVRGHADVASTFQQRQPSHGAQWIDQREEQCNAACKHSLVYFDRRCVNFTRTLKINLHNFDYKCATFAAS